MALSSVTETASQRKTRLMSWAALARLRVYALKDGSGYRVPSSHKGPDGKPVADYTVTRVQTTRGAGWYCPCKWGQVHGAYVPDVTDVALCRHSAQIIKHEERAAREQARAALVAGMDAVIASLRPPVPTPRPVLSQESRDDAEHAANVAANRRWQASAAGQAYADLFTEGA